MALQDTIKRPNNPVKWKSFYEEVIKEIEEFEKTHPDKCVIGYET